MGKRKYKPYKQGVFHPTNQEKYKGTLPVCYRSSLELEVMKWLDRSNSVIQWGSESIVIPYISPSDGRMHRYFVDFNFTVKRNGELQKFLVEVKPSKQTKAPKKSKNMKSYLYESYQFAVNSAKWESAKKWCKKNGYEFVIFTEKHINK